MVIKSGKNVQLHVTSGFWGAERGSGPAEIEAETTGDVSSASFFLISSGELPRGAACVLS